MISCADPRMRVTLLSLVLVALVLAAIGVSCVDIGWKEGIACSSGGTCPGAMTCCHGACYNHCPATTDGGADALMCPAEAGGCIGCIVGCACTCGTLTRTCCLQLGVGTCGCL